METFSWCPRINPTGDVTLRNMAVSFGDGYVQRAADGINNKSESWPLQFTGDDAYVRAIRNFLDAHQGYKAFLWSPPMGEQGTYVAPQPYQLTAHGKSLYTLAVTFVQDFRP